MVGVVNVSDGNSTFQVDESNLSKAQSDGFAPVITVFNGKEVHDVHPSKLSEAINDGFKPIGKPGAGQSFLRNAINMSAGGLSDEVAGGVEAAGRLVGVKGAGKSFNEVGVADKSVYDGDILENLKNAYQDGRDSEREKMKIDSQVNPKATLAGQVVGSVASPINKITKGMSLGKAGATLGGIYGFGGSEGDDAGSIAADTAKGAALGYVAGKGLDKVGKMVSPALAEASEAIANKISPAAEKISKNEILSAAKRLNIEVTPGMLDDTGFVERLESSLSKSPSIFGQSVAKRQRAVADALKDTVGNLTSDATHMEPFQVGEKFKDGVTQVVGERLDPISSVFNEVKESTKFIPVAQKAKDAIVRNIENLDSYSLTGGAGKPGQYVEMLKRVQNADQLKTLNTMLGKAIRAAEGDEQHVLIEIQGKIKNLEDNSIMRTAIQQAREGGMRASTGEKIGSDLIGDLKDARSGYRTLINDLGDIAQNSKLKTQNGPGAFLGAVDEIPSEKIQQKFFNTENLKALQDLKDKFPNQFELLRQGKLKDIADSAINNTENGQGQVSAQRFLNEVRGMGTDVKQLLFGDKANLVNDVQIIKNAIPRNFNPSGTAGELSFKDSLIQNFKDVPNYLLYRGASSNLGQKVGQQLSGVDANPIRDVTASAVQSLGKPAAQLGASDFSTKAVTGTAKWANQGGEKLIQHDPSISSEKIEELKKTKKGRELLIRASDLKPGTPAMKRLANQIEGIEN